MLTLTRRTLAGVAAAIITVSGVAFTVAAPSASASQACSNIPSAYFAGVSGGKNYLPGHFCNRSSDGWYRMVFQGDGNFVLYSYNGAHAYWSTGTGGKGAQRLALQGDGNIVIYGANNRVLWTAGSHANSYQLWNCNLTIQRDGNLVEYRTNSGPSGPYQPASGAVLWNSGTVRGIVGYGD